MSLEAILAACFAPVNILSMRENVGDVGGRIRSLRLQKGITIPVLSQLSGLSPGFLSQIETGKASLSLDSLAKVAEALGLCTGDLLVEPPIPRVVRAGHRPRVRWGDAPEIEYLAPPIESSQLQAGLMCLPPGGMVGGCDHVHRGQEILWVLSGTVRVIQGEYDEVLGAGDSALVDARAAHTYEAVGSEEACFLVITSPPADCT